MINTRSVIEEEVKRIKERISRDISKKDEIFRIGIEIEACLLDDLSNSVNSHELIEYFKQSDYKVDYEYGSCQFEYKTNPIPINELDKIYTETIEFLEYLHSVIQKISRKNNRKILPVFLGSNPSPTIFSKDMITDNIRYRKIAKWQKNISDAEIDGDKIKAFKIASAIQGIHINIQGKNPQHTIQMYNHILNLIPTTILIGSSGRLLSGKLYSIYEPRIFLYDQSENQNSGFPSIPQYFKDMNEYVEYIKSKPSILAKDYYELEKERHDDVRIRLNTNYYRIETRMLSVQSSIREIFSFIELFVGYIHKSICSDRKLRPLVSIREEREAVIRSGYKARTHFDLIESAQNQINIAKKGLMELGIKPKFISILDKRIQNHRSPSEYIAEEWDKCYNGNPQKTVNEIVERIWDKTINNQEII
ncbi:MAG: hypothetical protein ACPKPY_11905 [Nitrososphaeraceae archaeon]